jgi:hypothetical protein
MAFAVRATSTLRGWNANPIRQRAARVLQLYRPILRDELKSQIQAVQYAWPRQTRRRNGTTVTTPRDIVDTGAFLASQADFQPDPLILRYTWGGNGGPVTYAGIILRGISGAGRDGQPRYPARDWITPALRERPLRPFFVANWGRAGSPLPLRPRR